MRTFVLGTLVGASIAIAAPQFAAATPAAPGVLSVAADNVSSVDQAHYRWRSGYRHRWHHHYWHHRHWHHRHWHHRHCWHRRYWSGRRCYW